MRLIARLRGTLVSRSADRVEVLTAGGVGYELLVPLSVFERLPREGEQVELRTVLVVREDAQLLFGFLEEVERVVFGRLLSASGVGPKLALALLSSLSAPRLVRALRERDVTALTAVSGVGKRTAERLAVELAGKLDDVAVAPAGVAARSPVAEEAIRALAVLGSPLGDAERAVYAVLQDGAVGNAPELIRAALARLK